MDKQRFRDIIHNNSLRERRIETGVYHILRSRYFEVPIIFLILVDLVAVILQTFSSMHVYFTWFDMITLISAFMFTLEYVARLYSAPAMYPDLNSFHARIRYALSFLGLIDLICIAPFVFSYLYRTHMIKEFVDVARILLIFKFLHYTNSYSMIRDVIKSVKSEILTALSLSFLIVCFSAILMYYIERRAQPDVFTNVGEGFWWAIITFTTVGYGDVVPITPLGKSLACLIAFIGIITLMLPTGIISGALMNRIQEDRKNKAEKQNDDGDGSGSGMNAPSPGHEDSDRHPNYCPHCGKKLNKGV